MANILEQHPAPSLTGEIPGASIRIMEVYPTDADGYALPLEKITASALHNLYVERLDCVQAAELATVANPDNRYLVQQRHEDISRLCRPDKILTAEIVAPDRHVVAGMLYGAEADMPVRLWSGGHSTVAMIKDVLVRPAFEHYGIGSLLVNRFLADFNPEQMVVTRVLEANKGARHKLSESGFREDAYSRPHPYLGRQQILREVTCSGPVVKDVVSLIQPTLIKHQLSY